MRRYDLGPRTGDGGHPLTRIGHRADSDWTGP